jgi:hypothetical protein
MGKVFLAQSEIGLAGCCFKEAGALDEVERCFLAAGKELVPPFGIALLVGGPDTGFDTVTRLPLPFSEVAPLCPAAFQLGDFIGVSARPCAQRSTPGRLGCGRSQHLGGIMRNAFDPGYTHCGAQPPDDGCGECDASIEEEVAGIEHGVETGAISDGRRTVPDRSAHGGGLRNCRTPSVGVVG